MLLVYLDDIIVTSDDRKNHLELTFSKAVWDKNSWEAETLFGDWKISLQER